MKKLTTILLLLFHTFTHAQPGRIPVHDPVMIRQDSLYYLFCTGNGIAAWSSADREQWQRLPPVFDTMPQWAQQAIPGLKRSIWAPDVSFHNGLYYLYYSVSAFGKNTSAIGVATNPTLNPTDSHYHWTDHGMVIQSQPGKNHWNAIDPNLAEDEKGNPYLVFGSFWDGIKMIQLTPDRLRPAGDIANPPTIASRKRKTPLPGTPNTGDNAIEAPFVFRKGRYYYLFASIDYCCKGPQSTYKIIVGRAKTITGPYLDKDNNPMDDGGGTILLTGDKNWYGVGHNAVCSFDGVDYIVFHGYDAEDGGKSKLRVERLEWGRDGWPVVGR